MSLINQMLKDLQEQEKGKASVPNSLQSRTGERNRAISSPLVIICAGTLLLGLTWWAGSSLFRPAARTEPVAGPVEPRQIDKSTPANLPKKVSIAQPVQATTAEQAAVPAKVIIATPVQTTTAKQEAAPAPNLPVVAKQSSSPPEIAKEAAKVSPPAAMEVRQEQGIASRPVATMPKPAQSTPLKVPHQEVAVAARPLNPEKLPGAIHSSTRSQNVSKEITPLGSSYKMAEQSYQEGKRALEGANRELAVKSLQQALQLYAGHLPARELLAETYDKAGKDAEAITLLDVGLKIAPDYVGFKKIYSRILADDGDFNAAITIMMRGGLPNIKADPEAHEFLATLYHRLGESYLAAQTYRNLLAIWPQNGNYWFGLGDVLDKQGLLDDACGCYRTALETRNLRPSLKEQARNRLNLLGKGSPS